MGKLRQKNASGSEYFRGVIREQKSLIKSLRRQVRELEKRYQPGSYKDEDDEEDTQEIVINVCNDCGKGALMEKDFLYIKYLFCSLCNYKEKM